MADNDNLPPQPPASPGPKPPGHAEPPEAEDAGSVDFSTVTPVQQGASGVIPLAELPDPASTSSASLISWAEVIRQAREAAAQGQPLDPGSGLKVDAVSDKDLLRRIIEEEQRRGRVPPAAPPGVPDTAKLPPGQVALFTPGEPPTAELADSGIIPAEPGGSSLRLAADQPKPLGASGSVVRFPMHEPPPDAGGAIPLPLEADQPAEVPAPAEPVSESDIPFADEIADDVPDAEPVLMAQPASWPELPEMPEEIDLGDVQGLNPDAASEVNLAGSLSGSRSDEPNSSILEMLMHERGSDPNPSQADRFPSDVVNLVHAPPTNAQGWGAGPTHEHIAPPTDEGLDLGDSAAEASSEDVSPARDEDERFGPEDAVDLYAEGPVGRGALTESGSLQVEDSDIQAARRRAELAESSAIDLSSHPSLGGLDIEVPDDSGNTGLAGRNAADDSDRIDLHTPPEEVLDFSGAHDPVTQTPGSGAPMTQVPGAGGPVTQTPGSGAPMTQVPGSRGPLTQTPGDDFDITDAVEDSVDLSLPAGAEDDAGSSRIHRGGLTQDEMYLAAEIERQRAGRSPVPPSDAEVEFPADELTESVQLEAADEQPVPTPSRTREKNREPGTRPADKGRRGMLMGGLAGLVVGAGAFAGAWMAGLLPGGEAEKSPFANVSVKQAPNPQPVVPGTSATAGPAATPELARQYLELGEPARAIEVYDKLPAKDSPAVLAGLGQARWLQYLRDTAGKGGKLDPAAPEVAKARQDLQAAVQKWQAAKDPASERDAARAQLWQGLMEEAFDHFDQARDIYQKGADQFSKPNQAILQAAEARLNVLRPRGGDKVSALPPGEALLGFITLLQAPPARQGDADPASEEAGFRFWDALLLANGHQYAQAKAALAEAVATHDRQRVRQAGKGLNPLSDPLEQIFPRCCEDLQKYWDLRERIYKSPGAEAVAKEKGVEAALEAMVGRVKELESLAAKLKAGDKPGATLAAFDELAKAYEKTQADAKSLTELVDEVQKELKEAGIEEPKADAGVAKLLKARADADKKVKDVAGLLEKAGVKEGDPVRGVEALAAARDERDAILKSLVERLQTARYVEPNPERSALVQGLERALARASAPGVAELTPPAFGAFAGAMPGAVQVLQITDQVARYRAAMEKAVADLRTATDRYRDDLKATTERFTADLAQVRTPAQSLDLWLLALSDRANKAEAEAALADVARVQRKTDLPAEVQAKALAVKGLALRNQGDFVGARQALAEARENPGFAASKPWGQAVAAAADTLSNPAAFVGGSRAPDPVNPKALVEAIDAGLKLFPRESFGRDHARLLAQRSLAKLESDDLAGAAADAHAAVTEGAGLDGYLAAARVAERQGDYRTAESNYREVLRLADQKSPLHRQAQLGLARVLLRTVSPLKPAPKPEAAPGPKEVSLAEPTAGALVALLVLLQAPGEDLGVDEAIKLADTLIAQKEYLGHIIKADALARKGLYTEALNEYSTGLKRLQALPREYDTVLDRILANHPALQRPDQALNANPALAERLFSDGVRLYFERKYPEAETAFVGAIRNNARDARYMYFLGLSRWMEGKKSVAVEDFKAGAALERLGRPAPRLVSDSFERIQGSLRDVLEEYRP